MRPLLQWILKAGVSIAFLFAIAQFIDFDVLKNHLHSIVWWILIPIGVFLVISIFIRAVRFVYVYNTKAHAITIKDAWNLALVGETLNMILPGASGDIAKAYYGYKRHKKKEEMLSATVLDKLTGLLGLTLMGMLAALLFSFWQFFWFFAAVSVVLCIPLFIPTWAPWRTLSTLQKKFKKNYIDVTKLKKAFFSSARIKIIATGISIVGWLASFALLWLITRFFGLDVSFLFLCMTAPLINLSKLFPLSWSGLGVQEGVTAALFLLAGIDPAAAVLVSLTYTIVTTGIPGFFGVLLIVRWHEQK